MIRIELDTQCQRDKPHPRDHHRDVEKKTQDLLKTLPVLSAAAACAAALLADVAAAGRPHADPAGEAERGVDGGAGLDV
ncbi:MAG: hypothetical protein QOJ32_3438, partial [Frankiaceae bacterium]|nr:hypothetical protein [Frankiaceae bacterium]